MIKKECICKYCNEKYVITSLRQSLEHCRKDECKKKARVDAQKKYLEKKKKEKAIKKVKETKTEIINSNKYEDILEAAKELGVIRYKLIQMIKTENENVSKFDKKDQTFLHTLEFMDNLSEEEAIKMFIEERKNRADRRAIKNRQLLLQALLDGILVKAPNAFVAQVIKNPEEDFGVKINGLRNNNVLWVQKAKTEE